MKTRPIICRWPCVNSLSPSPPPKKDASPAKTFAQAISSDYDFSMSQLPKPCIKGDSVSIRISEEEYQVGLASCKNNLHGRILLAEGNQPIQLKDLRDRLQLLWKPTDHWRVTPLGRGFYEFSFASTTDLRRVWAKVSWNLKPGVLRLSQWVRDFNPNIQRQSHAQCWLRIYDLPQEYWRPKILFEIANGIGSAIALDKATEFKEFGHFARVLVEIHHVTGRRIFNMQRHQKRSRLYKRMA